MLKRLLTIAFCLVLLFLLPLKISGWLRGQTVRLVQPMAKFFIRGNSSLANSWQDLHQLSSLRQDKANLQKQVVQLQQSLADQASISKENETLRQELGVTGVTKSAPKILAHVVLQGSDPLDRTLTVDVGTSEGVKIGQPAVYQGALVGKILEVNSHSATIRLITSSRSRVQAWISQDREKGLLVGDGNSVTMTDITQGVSIPSDGIVETSGLGGSLPQGILIGQRGDIRSEPSDLSQSIDVKVPYSITSLESLFIILTDSSS